MHETIPQHRGRYLKNDAYIKVLQSMRSVDQQHNESHKVRNTLFALAVISSAAVASCMNLGKAKATSQNPNEFITPEASTPTVLV